MLFRMTLPRDVRLLPAIRLVAERAAQCAGYAAADAARIGASVGQAADAVIGRLPVATPPPTIDLSFERGGGYFDVWLRYPAETGGRRAAAVDAPLSSEVLRQGMDSVEFGSEDGVAYCRLRRVLPADAVDHQCEMPPPEPH